MRAEDRTNDEVTGMPDTKNGPKESLSVGAQSIATAPDDATVIEAPNNNKAAVFSCLPPAVCFNRITRIAIKQMCL